MSVFHLLDRRPKMGPYFSFPMGEFVYTRGWVHSFRPEEYPPPLNVVFRCPTCGTVVGNIPGQKELRIRTIADGSCFHAEPAGNVLDIALGVDVPADFSFEGCCGCDGSPAHPTSAIAEHERRVAFWADHKDRCLKMAYPTK